MAATLLPTTVALPPYRHRQDEIAEAVAAWLADQPEKAARARAIMARAGVEHRHTVRPLNWYQAHPSVTERSRVYREEMTALCEQAVGDALAAAGVPAGRVGCIITTSCTGLMIPGVEAHLMNRLPFAPDTMRMPLTQLGCAAGAAAIGQAKVYLQARPEGAAVIVAAELASLTAQVTDTSMANIVSGALFGDGAAATVAVGERFVFPEGAGAATGPEQRPAPRVVATHRALFPDTLEMMGFDNTDGGLKIFLSPQVPRFLRTHLPPLVQPFLARQGLGLEDVTHFLLHPGGPKVIGELERAFGLSPEATRLSHEVLRRYGNLSSATVLYLLHLLEAEGAPRAGDYGLLMAVGPGFCAEMALLQW